MLRKIYSLQQLLSGLFRPRFRRAGGYRVVVALTLAGLASLGKESKGQEMTAA